MHDRQYVLGVAFQLFEQLLRLPEVGDRVFGDILPLGQVGRLQPVADDDVVAVVGAQPGHNVGADEAGPAGHHDHLTAHAGSFIFSMVRVVE